MGSLLRAGPEETFKETSQIRIDIGINSCYLQLNTLSVSLKESALIDAFDIWSN